MNHTAKCLAKSAICSCDYRYKEGYAQAVEDATQIFTCWQPRSRKRCHCPSCIYKNAIKALLSRGSR